MLRNVELDVVPCCFFLSDLAQQRFEPRVDRSCRLLSILLSSCLWNISISLAIRVRAHSRGEGFFNAQAAQIVLGLGFSSMPESIAPQVSCLLTDATEDRMMLLRLGQLRYAHIQHWEAKQAGKFQPTALRVVLCLRLPSELAYGVQAGRRPHYLVTHSSIGVTSSRRSSQASCRKSWAVSSHHSLVLLPRNLAHPPRLSIPSICSVLFLYVCSRYCNFLSRFANSFLQSSASLSCFFCTSGILVPTNLFLLSAHNTPLHILFFFFINRTMFCPSLHTSFQLHRRPGSRTEDLTALCWTVGVCVPRASCSQSVRVRC